MQPAAVAPSAEPAHAAPESLRKIDSALLLQHEREIVIVHRGQEYHLRVTKLDKLILTK
jgi:hemin uptake protein HemP